MGLSAPYSRGDFFDVFGDISVSNDTVTVDVYKNDTRGGVGNAGPVNENFVLFDTHAIPLTRNLDEYETRDGNVWYYTQNKFGSDWVNKVDNSKGWTVDFNLRVSDVHNTDWIIDENNKGKGIGIYVNDGTRQEVINFLTQQIVFSNANHTKLYDTTQEVNYRLTGKNNNLKLYARPSGGSVHREISNVSFSKEATPNGNALKPSVFEDVNGVLHAVWWDDGGNLGTLYYSTFDGEVWTTPEEIVSLDNGVQLPSVIVDSEENVYVAFESKQTQGSVIGFVYKNSLGWSEPYYAGVDIGYCRHPKMTFDSQSNVCIVWEDGRRTHPEIYIDIFLKDELKWKGETKLSTNEVGSFRPSISSYMDDLFITWTRASADGTSSIEIIKYNAITAQMTSVFTISGIESRPDHSDILCNVSGKIFVVWHDNPEGRYQIYSTILSSSLDVLTDDRAIVNGHGGAKYPVLSEQMPTGNVYITWQDYKDGNYREFNNDIDPSVTFSDPYEETTLSQTMPLSSAIFIAFFNGDYISSGNGSFDIMLTFEDERNAYFPSIPPFFGGELPVLYESYLLDEYGFVGNNDMLSRIRCAYYPLERIEETYQVINLIIADPSNKIFNDNRDYILNKDISTKEIRFGDFSDVMSSHYIFKEFKYYLDDAVPPYTINEIDQSTIGVDSISAHDVAINNYGDVWIVGICGTYYYFNRQNRVLDVGVGKDLEGIPQVTTFVDPKIPTDVELAALEAEILADGTEWKKMRAIAFDKYNNMFMGGGKPGTAVPFTSTTNVLRYSTNHINGFKEINTSSLGLGGKYITSMVFDKDNRLYIGTDSGLFAYDLTYTETVTDAIPDNVISVVAISPVLPSLNNPSNGYITSLKVDDNNCLWIGTRSGIYRFFRDKFLKFTTVHGLQSDRVNDIAIRNTAIRYIATSNGIGKMVGLNFDSFITSEDESIWNNNVKSVMWRDPNVLFAGTMSRLDQIIINDVDETYSTVFYEPGASQNLTPDDFQTYYLSDEFEEELNINPDSIVEVFINGNKTHYGYSVGLDNKTIRFSMPLNNDDIVEAVIRNDLEVISTFTQTLAEKSEVGSHLLKIKDLTIRDDGNNSASVFAIAEGLDNEVKINDNDSILPFDRVHLDTHPPTISPGTAGIKIGDQVNKSVVRVTISGATDDVFGGDNGTTLISEGSGIDTMIISNNEGFLQDDGITPLDPIPFSTFATHDLGLSLEKVVKNLTLEVGTGTVVSFIAGGKDELYAGVSWPAQVYKYDFIAEEWNIVYTYDEDQYIDFIELYNNNLIISVGHDTKPANIYIYTYQDDGTLVETSLLPLSESRAHTSHILDSKFYIGTGLGEGGIITGPSVVGGTAEIEQTAGTGVSGAIYVYNDGTAENQAPTFSKLVENLDENVYGLTHVTGSANLLASSGPSGYIYEIDVARKSPGIIYNSSEAIISLHHETNISETFAGFETEGTIRRSIPSKNTFDVSFRTIPSKISVLKTFLVITGVDSAANYYSTFAAVGNVIYYLSSGGTWVWKYTHNEDINDMTFDDRSIYNTLYIMSDTGVTKLSPLVEEKAVYLKLTDRAGNETDLSVALDSLGLIEDSNNPFVDTVLIADLVDFVSENLIFELDELGNISNEKGGDSRFYSADKILNEKGEYISEIFDGTNDLVKWETLSWQVTELFDTSVLMYVRSSSSSTDILTTEWLGPFTTEQSTGVTLSHLIGQFIQFRAVLISSVKGMTPTFHKASIRAITTESVHFFTTNFVMPTRLNKGILTSKKIIPVSADIVFGINTTNSIDWTEYQQIDENRIFDINQTGHNLRVGIKFISPNRTTIDTTEFGEYGPYASSLYVNTVDFDLTNNTGSTNSYHFRVSLYNDVNLTDEVFSAYSGDSSDGFSVGGSAIPATGVEMLNGETAEVLFTVSGAANIECESFYFVKIEYLFDIDEGFVLYSNNRSFVASCTSSFIDNIDFDFTNDDTSANNYHFRIKFYQDIERTNEFLTVFSGNDRAGWFVDDVLIPEDGATVASGQTVNVVYRPDPDIFIAGSIFYITIEAHDGDDYVFSNSSYTFQVREVQSTESCGGYQDVPIVENFGLMFELDDNEFITLNI